jgi:multiple sugar transport system substrate-binding protein
MGISQGSKKKGAAWYYVQWACNKKNQLAMLKAGINPVASTPEDLARFIQSESTRWGKVVKESGIELN